MRIPTSPMTLAALSLAVVAGGCSNGSESAPQATVTVTQTAAASSAAWSQQECDEASQGDWMLHCQQFSKAGVESGSSDQATPSSSPSQETATSEDEAPHPFGEAVKGETATITVEAPERSSLDQYADTLSICDTKPKAAVKVKVQIHNISKKPFDVASTLIIDATSGDSKACDLNAMSDDEMKTIMPSRTATITKVFGVSSASEPLTVSVGSLGSVYWTNDEQALKASR